MHKSSSVALLLVALSAGPALAAPEAAPRVRHVPVNLSLFYPVGTAAYFDEPVDSRFSFNLVTGRTYGLQGLEIGTLLNWQDAFMEGAQLAAGLNVVGHRATGAQVSAAGNVVTGDLTGAQIAAGMNLATGRLVGGQVVAGLNLAPGGLNGWQVAGGVNYASGTARGGQIGTLNVSQDDLAGVQLGVLNVAERMKGLQIGVVNVSDDLDGVPIGLFSYSRTGRFEVDALYGDDGFYRVGLNSGAKNAYSIWSLGYRPQPGANLYALMLGLGLHAPIGESFYSKLELLGGSLTDDVLGFGRMGSLATLRGTLGWRLAPQLALKGGAAVNVRYRAQATAPRLSDRVIYASGDTTVWPSLFLGIDL